jgi:transposase
METMLIGPSDLRQEMQSLRDCITEQSAQIAKQAAQIAKMDILIQYYEEQLLLAKRRQFGTSSEQLDADTLQQLSIFNEAEALADKDLPEPELEEITYKRKKQKGKREQDLSGLPVERIEYELPPEERLCPDCDDLMEDIGVHVRRELKLIPAKVVILEHAEHTYACRPCGQAGDHTPIITANAPRPLISGSLASPSLVAHLMTQKYQNGLPLYRLEKGFQFDGVNISRQTMANWIISCALNLLLSIYLLLIAFLLKEPVLHSDETTLQVLKEPRRDPRSKSYEWVYRTSGCAEHPIIIYDYKETRHRDHPKEFLKDFKGYLHTDGYDVYHGLPPDITIVGCWAHARRYWENLLKTIPKEKQANSTAARGLAYIEKLFFYERAWKNLTPEERLEKRLDKSKPVSDAFFAWCTSLHAVPKSLLGQAVHYALSQRKYLENVWIDGRLELSNNRCERSVKPFVMGRKAWLFAATPNGATASSVIYSIIETAKENGLRPFQYMQYLLETLPNTTTSQLEALLPWSDSLPDDCRAPL